MQAKTKGLIFLKYTHYSSYNIKLIHCKFRQSTGNNE